MNIVTFGSKPRKAERLKSKPRFTKRSVTIRVQDFLSLFMSNLPSSRNCANEDADILLCDSKWLINASSGAYTTMSKPGEKLMFASFAAKKFAVAMPMTSAPGKVGMMQRFTRLAIARTSILHSCVGTRLWARISTSPSQCNPCMGTGGAGVVCGPWSPDSLSPTGFGSLALRNGAAPLGDCFCVRLISLLWAPASPMAATLSDTVMVVASLKRWMNHMQKEPKNMHTVCNGSRWAAVHMTEMATIPSMRKPPMRSFRFEFQQALRTSDAASRTNSQGSSMAIAGYGWVFFKGFADQRERILGSAFHWNCFVLTLHSRRSEPTI
mmetsp:Transcript_51124/g.143003  ORF Transcript_51124/g.143003 Transcript_51124/m.143003 type:complete len:324 (+) Transcript_51124:822-1793(+)